MVPAGLVVLLLFRLSQNVFALSLAHSDRSCDTAKAGLAWSDGNNSDITQFMGPQVSCVSKTYGYLRLEALTGWTVHPVGAAMPLVVISPSLFVGPQFWPQATSTGGKPDLTMPHCAAGAARTFLGYERNTAEVEMCGPPGDFGLQSEDKMRAKEMMWGSGHQ
ncbi:hypothetical protein B0H11DRAFT_2188535 [Mycena galericulata]|nr:hypothetical protein B0H11DRAFT_2195288 [Mycena galericulata]KAJ7480445.1 hypothetical protein B0H11DRAFT_2193748 [Mycena galericulata]KAJ7502321.1 hypothetical protein B0H11DRAFT_2188535 [Mycena galericulata]